jgi:hypothetical protein
VIALKIAGEGRKRQWHVNERYALNRPRIIAPELLTGGDKRMG